MHLPHFLLRTLSTTAARPRWFLLRTSLAATVSLAAVACAMAASRSGFTRGEEVVGLVVHLIAVALAVFTPAVGAVSLVEDRLRGMIPLILCTPVTARGLVLQRLAAVLALSLGTAAVGLPALAWIHAMFVPDPRVLAASVLALTALALELACWSVLASALARRRETALLLAYGLPAARWTAQAALTSWLWAGHPLLAEVLSASTPVGLLLGGGAAFDAAVAPLGAPGILRWFILHPTVLMALFPVLLPVVAVPLAAVAIAREPRARGGGGEPSGPGGPGRPHRPLRWPALLRRDPVAWKDLASHAAPGGAVAWCVAGLAFFAVGAWWTRLPSPGGPAESVGWLLVAALGVVCAAAAGAAASERGESTFDLLRCTRLTADDIARGKMRAVALRVAPVALAFVGLGALLTGRGWWHPASAALGVLYALAALTNGALLGLRWGTRCEVRRMAVPGGALAAVATLFSCPLAVLGPLMAVASHAGPLRGLGLLRGLLLPAATVGTAPFVLDGIDRTVMLMATRGLLSLPDVGGFVAMGWIAANIVAVVLWSREVRWFLREELRGERDLGDGEDGAEPPVGERLDRHRRRRERERAVDRAVRGGVAP